MRQGCKEAKPFCCADGMLPISAVTVYVTVSGQLLALAELDRGEIVPKRVFNLAGLIGSAGVRKDDDVGYRRPQGRSH